MFQSISMNHRIPSLNLKLVNNPASPKSSTSRAAVSAVAGGGGPPLSYRTPRSLWKTTPRVEIKPLQLFASKIEFMEDDSEEDLSPDMNLMMDLEGDEEIEDNEVINEEISVEEIDTEEEEEVSGDESSSYTELEDEIESISNESAVETTTTATEVASVITAAAVAAVTEEEEEENDDEDEDIDDVDSSKPSYQQKPLEIGVTETLQAPGFVLSFLWMDRNIAVAVDNIFGKGQRSPLTEYFIWPRSDAWEELKTCLESKPWVKEREKVLLLNRTTEVINFWQDEETKHTKDEAKDEFPDCIFM